MLPGIDPKVAEGASAANAFARAISSTSGVFKATNSSAKTVANKLKSASDVAPSLTLLQ